MMDWLVLPLATMFFGGALGGSSGNINLKMKYIRERKRGKRKHQGPAQSLAEEKTSPKHTADPPEAVCARGVTVNMPATQPGGISRRVADRACLVLWLALTM